MENKECIKCGEDGNTITLEANDGEFSSVVGGVMCGDCYHELLVCISEMLYPE